MDTAETHDYDPRFDRAQTIEGARARYAAHDLTYTIADLERDIERLLTQGEHPDRAGPLLGSQTVY